MSLTARRLEITAWLLNAKGAVEVEITCRGCGAQSQTMIAPGPDSGGWNHEHVAVVAVTLVLRLANRRLSHRTAA